MNALRTAFLLFVCVHCINAQQPLYTQYERFDSESGLPQINVLKVVQDTDGFIWASTMNGLVRYDGHEFKEVYQGSNGRTLSSKHIPDMLLDGHNLWLMNGHHKIDLIDTRTLAIVPNVQPLASIPQERFSLRVDFSFSPRMYRDAVNKNWFIDDTTHYHVYDRQSRLLSFFKSDDLQTGYILSFLEDAKGRLWKMTDRGLELSDTNWEHFQVFDVPSDLTFNVVQPYTQSAMAELADGRILFSFGSRAFTFDERSGEFKEIDMSAFAINPLSKLSEIIIDKQGRALFHLDGFIFRLEREDRVNIVWEFPKRSAFQLNSMLIDQSNVLWLAANTDGLYKINLNTPSFHPTPYTYNFVVDMLHNEIGMPYEQMPKDWLKEGFAYQMRSHRLANGDIVLSHQGSPYNWDRTTFLFRDKRLIRLLVEPNGTLQISGIKEHNGTYWLVDMHGNLMQTEDINRPPNEIPIVRNHYEDAGAPNKLINILDMVVDHRSQWLLSSENRLYKCQDGRVVAVHVPITLPNILTIKAYQHYGDSNTIWIGTMGAGLIQWDKKSEKFVRNFTTADGLPDENVIAIAGDTLGSLWLATFRGLSRFDVAKGTFTNYLLKDGLLESEFNRHHVFTLPNGHIAFGGTDGYIHFNPYEFTSDTFEPTVNFTQLSINNRLIAYSDTSRWLDQPLNLFRSLKLEYDQNELVFELASNQYNDPSKTVYRYQLEGYTNGWVELGNNHHIRFDHLPFGSYVLKVNATNTSGMWSSQVREVAIRVYPPPWLSWWAFVIYGLLILLVIILFIQNFKRKLLRAQEEEFNKKETKRLREMDEMKTRFFSNITHEFRTPLTLILSPLDKHIKDETFPPQVLELLKSNYRHGSHLLKLVNQLLDIAKLESGSMQLHEATGEFSEFIKGCLDQFQEMADQKDISLTLDSSNVQGHYLFDKGHWEKIVFNLLSNALKFTPTNGTVGISIKEEQELEGLAMLLKVKDSGIGIPPEAIPKLFDRFYQVDDSSTREQEGTGIGLALVKELTELMGGTIAVESKPGEGTTFTLRIPISKFAETSPVSMEKDEITPELIQEVNSSELPLLLIVEDNLELRDFIVASLREKWQVLEAPNGEIAWEIIQAELPEIVISDVMMPGMNGFELCRLTKGDLRTAHVNFIMLTAKAAQESKEVGLEAGADDYLTKPFHVHELELRIHNQLVQQQRIREHLQTELLLKNPGTIPPKVDDLFITKLHSFMDAHIDDPQLDIDLLSEFLSMSRSTLNRKLKSVLNVSPNEYIRQYRLQRASVLLSSGLTVAEVAFKVGFESPSYFTQCFREAYALTPTEFQKTADLNQN